MCRHVVRSLGMTQLHPPPSQIPGYTPALDDEIKNLNAFDEALCVSFCPGRLFVRTHHQRTVVPLFVVAVCSM